MEFKTHFASGKGRSATRRKTIMFGLLLITFGVIWMMKKLNLLDPAVWDIVFSWQALIIAIGLINVVNGHARLFGLLLILIGSFFMTMKLNILPDMYSAALWPSVIILIGLLVVFSSRKLFRKRVRITSESNDYFEEIAVFGGSERKINSSNFKGGEAVSVFGGSVIDLSSCELSEGVNKLEVVSVFGGVKLIVPPHWNIKTEMVNVLGGFTDKRKTNNLNPDRLLVIDGVAIFGGGEITTEIL